MSTLVVYFSRKGYVERYANEKAAKLGADVLRLRTKEHTEGILGFWWCGRFGMHRWEMELEQYTADVAAYDRVIVCSPVWVFTVCAPVRRFLKEQAGKIKHVEYMLVHFSFPMRYDATARLMDEILLAKHERYESVCCMWGREFARKTFE